MPSRTQQERQEKPLYSARYSRDAAVVASAASATEIPWLSGLGVVLAIIGLVLMIFALTLKSGPNWPLGILCIGISFFGTYISNYGQSLHARRLQRAGLFVPAGATKDELRYELNFFNDSFTVLEPSGEEKHYNYSSIAKLNATNEVIVLRCSDGSYVVVPSSAMSSSRYLNLIDFLDAKSAK